MDDDEHDFDFFDTDEDEDEEEELLDKDLMVEFYLKGRADPLVSMVSFKMRKSHLEDEGRVARLMHMATISLLEPMDTVGQHRMILADTRENKWIVMTDQIQAITILIPDEFIEGKTP